jgi:hypothetical protein
VFVRELFLYRFKRNFAKDVSHMGRELWQS